MSSPNKLYLICGVPASGKTWVCNKLRDELRYIPHDDYIDTMDSFAGDLRESVQLGDTVTECPFGETKLRNKLTDLGIQVEPVFVVENLYVLRKRWLKRTGTSFLPKNVESRAMSIRDRAIEWGCRHGTSEQVRDFLMSEVSNADSSSN